MIRTALLAVSISLGLLPTTVYGWGGTDPWSMRAVTYLKKQYDVVMDSLKEYRRANEALTDVKNITSDALREYDALQNAKAMDWRRMLERDIESLTELDNMEGRDREQKLRLMVRELDRRIADPGTSEAEREAAKRNKGLLLKREESRRLAALCREALKETGGAATERQLLQAQTQCGAVMAINEATMAEEQHEQALARHRDEDMARQVMHTSGDTFRAMADAIEGK